MRSLILAALVGLAMAGLACSSPATPSGEDVASLQITDVKVGTGVEATTGKTITVNYTGWLYSTTAADHHGSKFDSSRDPGRQPFAFTLGVGQVIAGWDQGVAGMKVGSQRTLVIPSSLAYGSRGTTGIPGNSALVFDVELLDVK
jgi:FKBP-type peptidyl-prolyl cis-trans isomerase